MLAEIKKHIDEDAAFLQKVILPTVDNGVEVFVKREELLHPTISGNKWRKLKYNLIHAHENNYKTLLTFGGAFSNHIHATASAGNLFGLQTIGIIRGEEHLPLNPTLQYAKDNGMQIHYIDRSTYRIKSQANFIQTLKNEFGDFYLVPEGGTNQLAVKGCTEIIDDINIDFDYIVSACGTGGTLSGIICGLKGDKNIIGIPVLKGAAFLNSDISNLVKDYSGTGYSNWQLYLDYHFGGYAKITKELIDYMQEFEKLNNIQLDPIYTAKMIYGIYDLIKRKKIEKNTRVIALHTGGLQGINGMIDKISRLKTALEIIN